MNNDHIRILADNIRKEWEHYDQGNWFLSPEDVGAVEYKVFEPQNTCGTQACLAGHAVALDGAVWARFRGVHRTVRRSVLQDLGEGGVRQLAAMLASFGPAHNWDHRRDMLELLFPTVMEHARQWLDLSHSEAEVLFHISLEPYGFYPENGESRKDRRRRLAHTVADRLDILADNDEPDVSTILALFRVDSPHRLIREGERQAELYHERWERVNGSNDALVGS